MSKWDKICTNFTVPSKAETRDSRPHIASWYFLREKAPLRRTTALHQRAMEVTVPSRILSCGALRPSGGGGGGGRRRGSRSSAFSAPSCSSSSSSCPLSTAGVSARACLTTGFTGSFTGGSLSGEICGQKLRVPSLRMPISGSKGKRGVVTMVFPRPWLVLSFSFFLLSRAMGFECFRL